MRKIYNSPYDHIVVVVDQERCLHISFPRAKLVPTYLFTHIIREPLVIRPVMASAEVEKFLFNIKHSTVGKQYDSARVLNFMKQSIWQPQSSLTAKKSLNFDNVITISAPSKPKNQQNDKVVCSHQIIKELSKVMPQLSYTILHDD